MWKTLNVKCFSEFNTTTHERPSCRHMDECIYDYRFRGTTAIIGAVDHAGSGQYSIDLSSSQI